MSGEAGAATGAPPRRRRRTLIVFTVVVIAVAATVLARWWTSALPPLTPAAVAARSCDGGGSAFDASAGLCPLPTRVEALTDYWTPLLQRAHPDVEPPRVLVYRGEADTSCGPATEDDEAFYCPTSNAVYLDLDAMDYYEDEWGAAPSAWLLAHEWAHHVQEVIGPESVTATTDPAVATRSELQADCLGGLALAQSDGSLTAEDRDAVLALAEDFGDDAGPPAEAAPDRDDDVPHGTGQQRVEAVQRGLAAAGPADCAGPVSMSLPPATQG